MPNPVCPVDTYETSILPDCSDAESLANARATLLHARAELTATARTLNSWRAVDALEDIIATITESADAIPGLAERCADDEADERRDWFAHAMATYHDSNR